MRSTRAFRWLLRLLPYEIRETHGREMEQVFEAAYRDRRGGSLRFWGRTVADVLRIAPRQHAEAAVQDLRYAWRTFLASPVFTLTAIATIALGIGATTAVFAVIHAVLLRPLPYHAPDRMAIVWAVPPEGARTWLSLPELDDLEQGVPAFQSLAALSDTRLVLTGGGEAEELEVVAASAELPEVFGVAPALGSWFGPADDLRNARKVVVLSDGLWRRRFGARPHVVGTTVQLDGAPHTVIGIMPREFVIPPPSSVFPAAVDAWVPLRSHLPLTGRDVRLLHVIGRLAPSATLGEARAQAERAGREASSTYPEYRGRSWAFDVADLQADLTHRVRPPLLVLFAIAALVLFIASANAAALMLSRGAARQHEIAVRMALGATSARLFRQHVTEALMLGIAGAIAGLALAQAVTIFTRIPPVSSIPRMVDVGFNWQVASFALALSLVTMACVAVVPLAAARRPDISRDTLRTRDRTRATIRAGRMLASAEIALACAVLIVALLLARGFSHLVETDPGFRTSSALTFRMALPGSYARAAEINQLFDGLLQRIEALPGVQRAAAVTQLPLSGSSLGSTFLLGPGDASRVDADLRGVTGSYFATMGIPLVAGRQFVPADSASSPGVAIVDEQFARRAWPGESAIGKRIRWFRVPDRELEVVGVVGPVRHRGFEAAPRDTVYRPHLQYARPTMYIVVRTSGPPETSVPAIREAVRAMDPNQPIAEVSTMATLASRSLAQPGAGAALGALFAAIALVLTVVGTYGVLAYAVGRRTREVGVRMAMGATRARIVSLIMKDGLRMAAAGLIVGIPTAVVVGSVAGRWLQLPVSLDALTVAAGAAVITAGTLAASGVPAWRASSVSPAEPLKAE